MITTPIRRTISMRRARKNLRRWNRYWDHYMGHDLFVVTPGWERAWNTYVALVARRNYLSYIHTTSSSLDRIG